MGQTHEGAGIARPVGARPESSYKVCTKCKEKKEVPNGFYKSSRNKDGRSSWCIDCEKIKMRKRYKYKGLFDRSKAYLGRSNPNCKYKTLDDSFFSEVSTESAAYLLGWVAGDGSITASGFTIAIQKDDVEVLEELRDIICPELPIVTQRTRKMVSLSVNSKTISNDLCNLLGIKPGKKSHSVRAPRGLSDTLMWAFLRGLFEADGTVNSASGPKRYPTCAISSCSDGLRSDIADFVGKGTARCAYTVEWSHASALDFLANIYSWGGPRLTRKYDRFVDWANWVPSIRAGGHKTLPALKWAKSRPDAVAPKKARASDSGYDLTLIDRISDTGGVELFETGVKVTPDYGVYFILAARSSLHKHGYMLANGIGIVDRSYTGTIKVALVKFDPEAPELELPLRAVQLIPVPIAHFDVVVVNELSSTVRGEGGFGSTGNQ